VRAAALEYVDAAFELSGWGNVFAGLHDDEDVDDDWQLEEDFVVPAAYSG